MSHSAVDVAYKMLHIAQTQGIELSNLQVQKLVYIAHGYLLGWIGKPLISDTVQAWKYGPVIEEVYAEFKKYGSNKIPISSMKEEQVQSFFNKEEGECLSGVLSLYGKKDAMDLINITHQQSTPWDDIWNKQGGKNQYFAEIPNRLIKQHYEKVIANPANVSGL